MAIEVGSEFDRLIELQQGLLSFCTVAIAKYFHLSCLTVVLVSLNNSINEK